MMKFFAFLYKYSAFYVPVFWCSIVLGQDTEFRDTLFVKNENNENLIQYVTYYIDSTNQKSVEEIATNRLEFKNWKSGSNLNFGLNPHPLWLYLNVTNTSGLNTKYWLSLYTQADSVLVFQKKENGFVCIDTLSYNIAQSERKNKVRFLVSSLRFEPDENKEIYLKVLSYTKTQHFIMDFTTPESNLLWERNFTSLILFFVGCFTLVAFLSFFVGMILRRKIFFIYGVYICIVILLLLSQELLLSIFPSKIFVWFNSIHPMSMVLIGLNFHYWLILYVTNSHSSDNKILLFFRKVNSYCFYYGVLTLLMYIVLHNSIVLVRQPVYHFLYQLSIVIILLLIGISFFTIIITAKGFNKKITHTVFAFLLLYFNPAGYYLNYSGIMKYYKITYPNYFYWILCIEFVILGYIILWRYRKTILHNEQLVQEKAFQEQQNHIRELEILEQEKKQIAQDLHDDLGATLSALKLIITNNYEKDSYLMNMISKANNDLRFFFSKLSPFNLKENGIFKTLETITVQMNRLNKVHFSTIFIGNERQLSDEQLLQLYRITSELTSNILKHSSAVEATLQLIIEEDQVLLMTEDNGKGYKVKEEKPGMGINNIYSRVQNLNGKIHISSNNSGTTTIIKIPLH